MSPGVTVGDVMRTQVVAVRERARFAEIVAAMRRFHISSLPVVDEQNRVVGLISGHDLLLGDGTWGTGARRRGLPGLLGRLCGRDRSGEPGRVATELMSSPAVSVTAATSAREAAREMYRYRIHQLPVVEAASGRLIGIVTRSDLLAVYERPDEDIRREILYDIIEDTLAMPPERFQVSVAGGTVTIRGRLDRHSDALRLAEAVTHVGGVITVDDRLTYELDDVARTSRARL